MCSRIAAERLALRALLAGAALVALAPAARAQTSVPTQSPSPAPQDLALAQSLFDEARQLMIASDFARACPKLAESERLDPALGTLLNLAVCNERLGKTASAWAEYRDAESVAKREGRGERESYAHAHAAQIEPRLSHVVLVRAAGNGDRDLEVRLDGATVGEVTLGSAVPVDPGEHRVEVRAAGKKAWSMAVTVGGAADSRTVEIPPLESAPAPPQAPAPVVPGATEGGPLAITLPSVPPAEAAPVAVSHGKRTAAYVAGGVGVAALAFGLVSGAQAIVQWNDRTKLCAGDACSRAGLDADSAARSWAVAADVGLGVGVVGVGAAAYLFFTSKSAGEGARATGVGGVRVGPLGVARGAGVGIDGVW